MPFLKNEFPIIFEVLFTMTWVQSDSLGVKIVLIRSLLNKIKEFTKEHGEIVVNKDLFGDYQFER